MIAYIYIYVCVCIYIYIYIYICMYMYIYIRELKAKLANETLLFFLQKVLVDFCDKIARFGEIIQF